MNFKFNDNDLEINIGGFSVRSKYHSSTLDYLDLLSRDIYDTEELIISTDYITTTNSGDISVGVQEKVKYGFKFSVCNILNNVGYLMTRNKYDIKCSRYINHCMQDLFAVDICQSIPLLYSEGMLLPSLHWKYTKEKCSIFGAIPSLLLSLCCIQEGFSSIQQLICTRLTYTSKSMGSDPRYICHYYDIVANLSASRNESRLVINLGLTVGENKNGNLGVRGSGYSPILVSVYSKFMVKNTCISQKYTSWSYF